VSAKTSGRLLSAVLAVFALSLFLPPGLFQAAVGLVVVVLVAVQDFGALRAVGRLRFWFFPGIFFALAPLWVGHPDMEVWGRSYSRSQLGQGAAFLWHAYVFTALVALLSRRVSARMAAAWAEKCGLRSFGLRLALALIALKLLRRMLAETIGVYRRQRPGIAGFLKDLPVLAGAVTGNCARLAENIAILFYIRGIRV